MRSRILLGGLAVLAIATIGGCGGSSSGGTGAGSPVGVKTPKPHPDTPSPTATVTPTPTATVTATSSPPGGGSNRCLSSHLALSLGQGQGAAGTLYTPIVLTNTSGATCDLHGYPGVSFVDSTGGLLGTPSHEDPGKIATITLTSGAAANSLLRQPNPGNFPAARCKQTTADRLRVYPPGETEPLFIKDAVPVCTTKAGRTGITPVAAGSGG